MSHESYSEYEPTDDEIIDQLEQIYPDTVSICGYEQSQAYALKRLDRVAFDMFASDNMRYYQCDECLTVYRDDEAEDKAMECCQEYCDECNTPLDKEKNYSFENSGLCDDCQDKDEGE